MIKQRFARRLASYAEAAQVQRTMAGTLLEKLQTQYGTGFKRIFEFGCGAGTLTGLAAVQLSFDEYILNDLVPESGEKVLETLNNARFLPGDVENIAWPEKLDLVLSGATMQWMAAPEMVIQKCASALSSAGVLAFSTFGGDNLPEIKQLTQVGLAYPPEAQWRSWLGKYFKHVEVESVTVELELESPLAVLRHLRDTGVNGIAAARWNKQRLNAFINDYQTQFGRADGKVRLSYNPVYIVAGKE